MTLHFQGYGQQPKGQTGSEIAESLSRSLGNLGNTVVGLAKKKEEKRQSDLEQAIRQQQAQNQQTIFDRMYKPVSGPVNPGEGSSLGQGASQDQGGFEPYSPDGLKGPFQGMGGQGFQPYQPEGAQGPYASGATPKPLFNAPQSTQNGSGSAIIDHWNKTMGPQPGQSRADYQENLSNQKTMAEIEKDKAAANQQYVIPQMDAQGNITGYTPLPQGSKPTAFAKPPNATLGLSEKEEQFYQKEWDKIVKDSDPLTATSRSGLGMASKADFNANRALTTLSKPMVTNQEAGNVMADIAQIYQGGSATQYGMSHQGYNTLYSKIQGAIQNLTGNPQDAVPDAIKQRLLGVLQDMKVTNNAVMKQQLDHLERAQPKVIGRYKDEWANIRKNLEQGVAGGPQDQISGQDHPEVGQSFQGSKIKAVRQIK